MNNVLIESCNDFMIENILVLMIFLIFYFNNLKRIFSKLNFIILDVYCQ